MFSPRHRLGRLLPSVILLPWLSVATACPSAPRTDELARGETTELKHEHDASSPPLGTQRKTKVRKEKDSLGTDPDLPVVLGRPISEIYFEHYGVNPTIDTEEENVSSFGLDVDTTSYALARATLEQDELPDENAVRVEAFLNHFDYVYPPPETDDFAIHAEVVPSPKRPGYHVLHLGVRARDLEIGERRPANLVFVIAASASMAKGERMPLVRDSLRAFVTALDERDSISIVAYSSDARVLLEPTPGHERDRIVAAIDSLHAEGSTNLPDGLRMAFDLATPNPLAALYGPSGPVAPPGLPPHIDRVLLLSDGLANTESTDAQMLLATVTERARRGISLYAIGIGMGGYNDALMEELAHRGKGRHAYVDRIGDAQRVFIESLTDTLQVVGYDAKIQVEFERSIVARYRLVGYESRGQFDGERDADREIGAGHSVTAIYEIQLRDAALELLNDAPGDRLEAAALGTVRLRYRQPGEISLERIEKPLPLAWVRKDASEASPATQLSIVVAAFAEKLRGSYWVRSTDWETIIALFEALPPELHDRPTVNELGTLIRRSARLDRRQPKTDLEAAVTRVDFDRVPVLK